MHPSAAPITNPAPMLWADEFGIADLWPPSLGTRIPLGENQALKALTVRARAEMRAQKRSSR